MTMPHGEFHGRVVVEWLADGRNMLVIEPFHYVDQLGVIWDVPIDTVTDGASIPQAAWSMVGGPFSGKYRKAALVHDRYCDTRSRPWEDVHLMFWHAMRCAGVGEVKAEMLYRAVYAAGPRWDKDRKDLVYEYPEEW